jgi:hypothetical protein
MCIRSVPVQRYLFSVSLLKEMGYSSKDEELVQLIDDRAVNCKLFHLLLTDKQLQLWLRLKERASASLLRDLLFVQLIQFERENVSADMANECERFLYTISYTRITICTARFLHSRSLDIIFVRMIRSIEYCRGRVIIRKVKSQSMVQLETDTLRMCLNLSLTWKSRSPLELLTSNRWIHRFLFSIHYSRGQWDRHRWDYANRRLPLEEKKRGCGCSIQWTGEFECIFFSHPVVSMIIEWETVWTHILRLLRFVLPHPTAMNMRIEQREMQEEKS